MHSHVLVPLNISRDEAMQELLRQRNELEKYLKIAVDALEKIKQARGGMMAVDDLGHERDLPNYEGDVAINALKKIDWKF